MVELMHTRCSTVLLQTSMNAFPMEDWVHVHKTVPIPLDHFSAAVSLDMFYQDMPAMVYNHQTLCSHKISDQHCIRSQ